MIKTQSVAVVLGLLFFCPALAEQAGPTHPSTGAMAMQLVFALGFVIAVIFALAWIAKKLSLGATGSQKHMQILGVLPLSAREKAILVEVSGKRLLLGVAPGRVATLYEYAEHEIPAQQRPETTTHQLAARSVSEFSKKLQAFLAPGKTHE